ncbi:MAG: hypothetical protein D6689_13370, partial [Deltaproteobacteria bacterium]
MRAEVDWVWLRDTDGAAQPVSLPRVMPIPIGGTPKRALPAPTPRTYSFYLHVPPGASLVFDYGADRATTFAVRAQADGEPERALFEAQAKPNAWTEAAVDLSPLAGKAIRLDLATSGAAAAAGWGEPEIMVPPADAAAPAGPPARNVVLILIDTARADAFAPGSPVKTPAYDAFAKQATVFVNAYNNENWTKPSVATTLTGLYPVTHDTKRDPSVLPDDVTLLSEQFKSAGFATGAFVANGFISGKFGFDQGWDFFRNYIREERPSDAEHVYADALEWIDQHKGQRFFAYIQTIDPHVVYQVDRKYSALYFDGDYDGPLGDAITAEEQVALSKGKLKATDRDRKWLEALYNGEITYHDEHMGAFLDALAQRGLDGDTLVVITNDHGEELGEHGRWGHGHSLYDELLRDLVAMRYPPLFPAGKRIADPVEDVDLAPTILEVAGVDPIPGVDGESLVPLVRGGRVARPLY